MTGRKTTPAASPYFNWAAYAPDLGLWRRVPGTWDELVAHVKADVSALLGTLTHNVSLHHNTTAAFQRIVIRLQQHFEGISPVLLLTDLEYPGIIALLDEQWRGPVVMVEVAECVWANRPSEVAERLQKAARRFKPQVVVLSHVSRSTGLCLSDTVLASIKSSAPGCVLVLDGAQAVGNISVTATALDLADFYVFSGHKWLRGLQTLGFVAAKQDRWHVDDPAQGYSVQAGARGTGSERVLASLVGAFRRYPISEIGRRTQSTENGARAVSEALGERGVRDLAGVAPTSDWIWSGLVTVPLLGAQQLQALATAWRFEIIGHETFRNPEFGTLTAGPRVLITFRPGIVPELRQTFCDVAVPLPAHGALRICVGWDYDIEVLRALATVIGDKCRAPGWRRPAASGR